MSLETAKKQLTEVERDFEKLILMKLKLLCDGFTDDLYTRILRICQENKVRLLGDAGKVEYYGADEIKKDASTDLTSNLDELSKLFVSHVIIDHLMKNDPANIDLSIKLPATFVGYNNPTNFAEMAYDPSNIPNDAN